MGHIGGVWRDIEDTQACLEGYRGHMWGIGGVWRDIWNI